MTDTVDGTADVPERTSSSADAESLWLTAAFAPWRGPAATEAPPDVRHPSPVHDDPAGAIAAPRPAAGTDADTVATLAVAWGTASPVIPPRRDAATSPGSAAGSAGEPGSPPGARPTESRSSSRTPRGPGNRPLTPAAGEARPTDSAGPAPLLPASVAVGPVRRWWLGRDRRVDALISELVPWIRTRASCPQRVAVVAGKGGVGRTTLTALLGTVMAELRGDRVVALDADPGPGTLAARTGVVAARPVQELLAQVRAGVRPELTGLARFTGLSGRLEVVAVDPTTDGIAATQPGRLTEDDLDELTLVLSGFYHVLLADCGGWNPGMVAAVRPDHVLVVGTATADRAGRAEDALDWLAATGVTIDPARVTVALNLVDPAGRTDLDRLREPFARRGFPVVPIPQDPALRSGETLNWSRLATPTRLGVYALAAHVAASFADHAGQR